MTDTITIGNKAPSFTAIATGDQTIKLKDLAGKNIILYFYPRDNTPGCTQESQEFSEKCSSFKKHNAIILGISRDTLSSHEKFKAKYEMPFELIADPEETLCECYKVMKMKNMYGKQVRGIERSTFLIDEKGVIRQIWRKVKVPGHVDEVLESVKSL